MVAKTLSGELPDLLDNLEGWNPEFENFNIPPTAEVPAAAVAGLAGLQKAVSGHAEQITELQRAVLELADLPAPPATLPATDARLDVIEATLGALQQRIVALEARGAEQEQAIRHVLTMLIEWLESETPRRAA